VTIAVTSTLPAQPTTGTAVYRPLGGNGWTSPHALYTVNSQSAGDASGGGNQNSVVLDTRFANIVNIAQALFTGDTTTVDGELAIIGDQPTGALHRVNCFGTLLFLSTLSDFGLLTWSPPPVIGAQSVFGQLENVLGTIFHLSATIYCFQKRVFEEVPLNVILASLPSTQYINVNS